MAKSTNPLVLDAALDYLSTNAVRYDICSTAPTNYTQATSTNSLGNVAIDGTDFAKANGTVSGRKTTVGAQTGVSITATGTAAHVALSSGSALLYVTELSSSQAVTSGNTADVAAFEIEIRDPS
jgi:hypothetical protein